jgi:hypothetical protein
MGDFSMKKVLFFSIGFLIPFLLSIPYLHAECTYNPTDETQWSTTYLYLGTVTKVGYQTEMWDIGCGSWTITSHNKYLSALDGSGAYINVCTVREYPAYSGQPNYYLYFVDGTDYGDVCISEPVTDTDGDGLSDQYDFYPNDPTDYKIRLLSYQEDSEGNRVRECYETDRKDIFCIGNAYDETLQDNITIGSDWLDSDDIITAEAVEYIGDDAVISDSSDGETSITSDTYTDTDGTPTETNSDTEMNAGIDSDGTETAAEQKIIDNTASTANNISRLADYLKDTNDSLGNIDYSTAQTSEALDEISNPDSDDVTTATSQAGDTDTAFQTAQDTITTEASLENDAPDDFKEKTDISTAIADYISNNPLSDIIENSGVSISGATSSAAFDYNGHSISLSVAGYDDQLEAFGQILLGIVTLAGMLLIFRGF